MKKRMLPMMLVCSMMMCQPVWAPEQDGEESVWVSASGDIMPFASNYIEIFDGNVDHLGNGKLEITGKLKAYDTDKLEIKAQVQSYSGGTWSNYGAATTVSAAKTSITMDREKTVPDGKYRVKFTFNVYVGSKVVETKTLTTTSVIVKK